METKKIYPKILTIMAILAGISCIAFITNYYLNQYANKQSPKTVIDYQLTQSLINKSNNVLHVSIDNMNYDVSLTDLQPQYIKQPISTTKSFIPKIFASETSTRLIINVKPIINKFPIDIQNTNGAYIKNKTVYNCESNKYNLAINFTKLTQLTKNALQNGNTLQISLKDILVNPDEAYIFDICNDYESGKISLTNSLKNIPNLNLDINDIFIYNVVDKNNYGWELKNTTALKTTLTKYASTHKQSPKQGSYEIIDNKIYLYQPYEIGKEIDINKTIENIQYALRSHKYTFQIAQNEIEPNILKYNLPILDFTQVIGIGKTRLPLKRNNHFNYAILYAEGPLNEINNYVIHPGDEFSFIKAIAREKGENVTKNGYPVGEGSCNSTTTIFRSALEAGLPITERHDHGFFVESYGWGYPYNLVDAAYYPDPPLDFKFKNDLQYPILIQFIKTSDDTYQYHTVFLRSSAKVRKRDVNITNWKIWNKYDNYHYTGSFDRIIKENGIIVKKETFTSRYYNTPFLGD